MAKKVKRKASEFLKKKPVAIFLTVILLILFTLFVIKTVGDINGKIDSNTILIKTSMGDITVELNQEDAPITVENFLSYVDTGFYDNLIFHRVIAGFMIQGGGFETSGTQKKTNLPIELESDNGLSNSKYTIAMARTNVSDSATSQFFINVKDNTPLDYSITNPGYAVFGKVTKGQDVVDKIEAVKTITKANGMQNWPVEDVIIYSIERI